MCRGLWVGFPGWSVRVRNGAYFSFRVFFASAPGGEDVPEHSWNRRSQEAAVIVDRTRPDVVLQIRRFGTGSGELRHLSAWLCQYGVGEAVMEGTGQDL